MASRQFDSIRLELDQKTTLANRGQNFYQGKIKSFQVVDASDDDVKIYARFPEGDEILLKSGKTVYLKEARNGVSFHWEAQSGKWARIEFSDSEYIPTLPSGGGGSSAGSSVGDNFSHENITIDETIKILVPATEKIHKVRVINKSNIPVYVGTSDSLADYSYINIKADLLDVGDELIYENRAALYMRGEEDMGIFPDGLLKITELVE